MTINGRATVKRILRRAKPEDLSATEKELLISLQNRIKTSASKVNVLLSIAQRLGVELVIREEVQKSIGIKPKCTFRSKVIKDIRTPRVKTGKAGKFKHH